MPVPAPARRVPALLLAAVLAPGLAACTQDGGAEAGPSQPPAAVTTTPSPDAPATPAPSSAEIALASDGDRCEVDRSSVPAGPVVLRISNAGDRTTDVSVATSSGNVVAEREDIAAGSSGVLVAVLGEGGYEIACRAGTSDDVRTPLTVTAAVVTAPPAEAEEAVEGYRDFVAGVVDDMIAATEDLIAAVKSGRPADARARYAASRAGWETVEPVAGSIRDLEHRVAAKEADLGDGDPWTGWHRIEKAIFADKSVRDMSPVGDQLLSDLEELRQRVPDLELTVIGMAEGAEALVSGLAGDKLTGHEEVFGHTDISDGRANLDGARKVFDLLRPLAERKDPELVSTLTGRFDAVAAAFEPLKDTTGYVTYDKAPAADLAELRDLVDELAEPLPLLAAAVV